jgi:hypothetical protein
VGKNWRPLAYGKSAVFAHTPLTGERISMSSQREISFVTVSQKKNHCILCMRSLNFAWPGRRFKKQSRRSRGFYDGHMHELSVRAEN